MFGLGVPELVIIILVVAVLFFGGNRIVEFSRSLGRVTGEFKRGKREIEHELRDMSSDAPSVPPVSSAESVSRDQVSEDPPKQKM